MLLLLAFLLHLSIISTQLLKFLIWYHLAWSNCLFFRSCFDWSWSLWSFGLWTRFILAGGRLWNRFIGLLHLNYIRKFRIWKGVLEYNNKRGSRKKTQVLWEKQLKFMQLANTEIDESLSLRPGSLWSGFRARLPLNPSPWSFSLWERRSFLAGLLELGLTVCESHIELLGALDDVLPLESWDVLGNLTAVGSVVHQENFDVLRASDQKLAETTWEHVSGLRSLLVTDLWHCSLTSEPTAHWAIDTSGFSPGFLNTTIKIFA